MAEYEKKFIVINKKRFDELNNLMPENGSIAGIKEHPAVAKFLTALEHFQKSYERDMQKSLYQNYYVVNQDEPYAKNVIKFILDNEDSKK